MHLRTAILPLCALLVLLLSAKAQEPFVLLCTTDCAGTGAPSRHYTIAPGENLLGILRQYRYRATGLQSVVAQVVQDNPRAFLGGDPNRMVAGQTLILPDIVGGPTAPDSIYVF